MSLRQANMVKSMTASGGGTLEARAGESLRVKRIEVVPSAHDTYITVGVDRVTVAFYRVKGKAGNHLGTLHGAYLKGNLMEFLAKRGVNVAIPVAEGQVLSVSRYAEAGNVMLIYDRYDAGDVKATDPNGSEGKEYTFIQYAEVGTTPTAAGDVLVDTSLTPSEFPNFPCGAVVPANHNIEMLGIAGSAFADGTGGVAGFSSKFLKLLKDREVLFDVDRNGLPFDGQDGDAVTLYYRATFSLIGPGTEILVNTNAITPGDPLMFEPTLMFTPGAELNVLLTLSKNGAAPWKAHVDDEAFILRVRRT